MDASIVEESINVGCPVMIWQGGCKNEITISIYSAADPTYLMLMGSGTDFEAAVKNMRETITDVESGEVMRCKECGTVLVK